MKRWLDRMSENENPGDNWIGGVAFIGLAVVLLASWGFVELTQYLIE